MTQFDNVSQNNSNISENDFKNAKSTLNESICKYADTIKPALYIVATPIGNIGDITFRALKVLETVDLIVCEDTRVTGKLLHMLGLEKKQLFTCHDYNEQKNSAKICDAIKKGNSVALVSDAGTPLVSDPGYKLVRECLQQKIDVESIPGASSVINALVLSGLPSDRFMFMGFLPKKESDKKEVLSKAAKIDSTLIFFETAKRIKKTLESMENDFSDRQIAVMREMTKKFEEAIRGTPSEVLQILNSKDSIKGEIVLVVEPPILDFTVMQENEVIGLMGDIMREKSLKSAVSELVDITGWSKKRLYELALVIKQQQEINPDE